jgi:hypothetical protein
MNTKKKTNMDEKKSRSTTNQTETVEANVAKAPPAELNKENNTPHHPKSPLPRDHST